MSQPDFLQEAWETPEPFEVWRSNELGLLVTLDPFQVVEGHVLLVARQPSWEHMSDLEVARFGLAGQIIRTAVAGAYDPARGVGKAEWGGKSPTPHMHIFPRDTEMDGDLFFHKASRAPEADLMATKKKLQAYFVQIGLAEDLQKRLGAVRLQQ